MDLRGLDDVAAVVRLTAIRGALPSRWVVVDVGRRDRWDADLLAALAGVASALTPVGGRCAVVAQGGAVGHGLLWSASREAALAALSAEGAVLGVAVEREPGGLRVVLRGRVDLEDRFVLDAQLERVVALAARRSRVVIDLRDLSFADIGSLRSLSALERDLRRAAATVEIIGAEGSVRRAMSVLSDLAAAAAARSAPASPLVLDEVSAESDDAVIVTDLEGRVTAWNRAAERLYGWTAAEVIGRPIGELTVGPQDRDLAEAIMQGIQATGSWEGEFTVYRRDGRSLLAHVRDTLVRDADGRPVGVRGRSYAVTRPRTRTAA